MSNMIKRLKVNIFVIISANALPIDESKPTAKPYVKSV